MGRKLNKYKTTTIRIKERTYKQIKSESNKERRRILETVEGIVDAYQGIYNE